MWMGISKTYAAGAYTDADWLSVIGAWLQANPGQLDVLHTAGVSLEWKSKAARPDRAHFCYTLQGWLYPVSSAGWSSDAGALVPDHINNISIYTGTSTTGGGCVMRFAIDTFTGRAWMMVIGSGSWSNVLICDLLQRGVSIPTDFISTNVVANIDVSLSNGDMGGYSAAAYYVNNSGVRVAGDANGMDEYYSLTTPVMNFQRHSLPGDHAFPPGSPQKILLPYNVMAVGSIQPHGPLTIASYANGPGFTADEVLATIDDLQIEYKHFFRTALHAPLPANWTVAV